jgi:mRNA interferase RelE/StbE
MFTIEFSSRAKKEYEWLEKRLKRHVEEALRLLKLDPVPAKVYDIRKLKGIDDTFRIRIGKIRIVYTCIWNDNVIVISRISPRESVYD